MKVLQKQENIQNLVLTPATDYRSEFVVEGKYLVSQEVIFFD